MWEFGEREVKRGAVKKSMVGRKCGDSGEGSQSLLKNDSFHTHTESGGGAHNIAI